MASWLHILEAADAIKAGGKTAEEAAEPAQAPTAPSTNPRIRTAAPWFDGPNTEPAVLPQRTHAPWFDGPAPAAANPAPPPIRPAPVEGQPRAAAAAGSSVPDVESVERGLALLAERARIANRRPLDIVRDMPEYVDLETHQRGLRRAGGGAEPTAAGGNGAAQLTWPPWQAEGAGRQRGRAMRRGARYEL